MDQRQIFLRDILTVLFKRKGFIVSFVIVVTVLVAAGNYVWPKTYESVAKVQVMRGRETVGVDPTVLEGTAMPMVQLTNYDVNTTIDLVTSNDVLRRVVQETELDRGMTGGLIQAIRRAFRKAQYALRFAVPPDPVQEAADELRDAILVEPVKDSYVLEIRCRMARPDLAHKVLTALVKQFQEKYKEVYSTRELKPFFEAQLERVSKDLQEKQKQLEVFRNENNIVSLKVEQDLLVEQYTAAQRLLNQLAESEAVAARVEGASQGDSDIIAALSKQTESTVVTELQLRLLDKIVERNRLINSLGPKHPQVVGILNEIEALSTRLKEAIASTREITQRKIKDIEQQMQKINTLMGQLENLERDVKIAAQSYEYYQQKIEESTVYDKMAEQNISSIRLTSSPTLPDNPISPKKLLNIVLALIGGLIGGVALAFFFEYLDHGLKTPEDVEYYLKLAPLASFFHSSREQLDANQSHRLSAMLMSLYPDRALQTVMVTSSVPGEGSHRVARALAEAQADDPESRILLLDCVGDAVSEMPGGKGILDVLEGDADLGDVITRKNNLSLIGRGSRISCPAYLWNSERMRSLLGRLRQEYTRVVIHAAPITVSHDALYVSQHADGILIVIRADSTRREVVQRAIETLGEAKQRIVGAVLTERRQVIPPSVYRRI